jgi:hypothetical protein
MSFNKDATGRPIARVLKWYVGSVWSVLLKIGLGVAVG